MSGFIEGDSRDQSTLLPDCLDDYITEENPIRVIDVFLDSLNLNNLGFKTISAKTGRPAYHPSTMLKLYVYGYLNRIQSSRRLERVKMIISRLTFQNLKRQIIKLKVYLVDIILYITPIKMNIFVLQGKQQFTVARKKTVIE
jgi:hypothetical protein